MKTTKDTLFKLGNRNENEEFRSKRTGRAAAQV